MGHCPFCASASTSVPGAPASSLVTGSQPVVLKPVVEIFAPVADVLALLSTDQPFAPRSVMSLAPVLGAAASAAALAGAAGRLGPAYAVTADVRAVREAITSTAAAASAGPERIEDLMIRLPPKGLPPLGMTWRSDHLYAWLTYVSMGSSMATQVETMDRRSGLDLGEHIVPRPVQASGQATEYDRLPAEHRHLDRRRRERE